nr:MAG TPA_asm: hypothetical protein [Caudoviricetes sp.]
MENLTPITLPQLDVEALAERAATIRDAINAKSVSAQQVGALFYDLVEYCGNVRDALSLFINSNLPEIQQDIDRRLAGVDSAVEKAAAELQKSEAARALVESLVASLSSQNLAAPLRIDIRRCPGSVTLTNAMRPRIDAALFPRFGLGSIFFYAENSAARITPAGEIIPVEPGTARIYAVATGDTSIYQALTIEVVPPRLRMADGDTLRLDAKGNLRFT